MHSVATDDGRSDAVQFVCLSLIADFAALFSVFPSQLFLLCLQDQTGDCNRFSFFIQSIPIQGRSMQTKNPKEAIFSAMETG